MALRIVVSGRVQGVSYRAWTVKEARRLGLSGWVRNRSDGTVEMLLSGRTDAVAELAQACARGPMLAAVARVEQESVEEDVEPGFSQRPTV